MPEFMSSLTSCQICPRECGVDRMAGESGFCGAPAHPRVARIALHHWEEPPLSGSRGSGTVFFTGCNLKCRYCQNHPISQVLFGKEISVANLAGKFLTLQNQGAHNVNLVTGAPYLPQIAAAVRSAKKQGLTIPVVYNSSGYEKVSSLQQLDGLIDVYLPDLKYGNAELGRDLSGAPDYFATAAAAIIEMVRQRGPVILDDADLIRSGVIVRHLILPGFISNSLQCLQWLRNKLPDTVYLSLMAQYTPLQDLALPPPLNRKLSAAEYETVLDEVFALGFENGFIQELEAATADYIPAFDLTGV